MMVLLLLEMDVAEAVHLPRLRDLPSDEITYIYAPLEGEGKGRRIMPKAPKGFIEQVGG